MNEFESEIEKSVVVTSEQKQMSSSNYKIPLPVDFSNRSVSAAPHVKFWREHFGATLGTVHVVESQRYGQRYDQSTYSELKCVVARRTADLEQFCQYQLGKNAARAVVLTGISRAEELERFMNQERIDLVMLPRNHQGFVGRFFCDSIAALLLERCNASVWISEHLEGDHAVIVNNILCAMHFEHETMLDAQNLRILETVRQLVSNFGAEVTFLQVTGSTKPGESWSAVGKEAGSQSWMAQAQDLLGESIRIHRRPGNVISGIRETVDQIGANLVVVGRVRPEAISFGRQSRILKIDHAVHCPVLSVW